MNRTFSGRSVPPTMTFTFLKGEILVGQKLVLVKVNEAAGKKICVILYNKETVTTTFDW